MDGILFDLPAHGPRQPSPDEIIVVGFAGGGGTCEGIRMALGRSPDEALNHDEDAVSMHRANHPETNHWCQNIWQASPADVARGRPIGLAWFSPDCTHFSKAKGGVPRKKHIRDLAWVVVAYAKLPMRIRPRVLMLENVEEFVTWGPLTEAGHPCPDRRGHTFREWVGELRRLGYRVEWRESRACTYGAPTIRKRLAVIARCDGRPIVWLAATHGPATSPEVLAGALLPYRTAARDVIDWSIPCPSIFLMKEEAKLLKVKRPLEENTLRRIFAGLRRYVIEHADPFIIPVTHGGGGGKHAVIAPYLSRQFGQSVGHGADEPSATVTAGGGGKSALVMPWMVQHNTGAVGHSVDGPTSTILNAGSHQMLAAASLMKLYGTCRDGQHPDQPMPTVTAGGSHVAEVRAFLTKYYGEGGQDQDCRDPLHTVPTKARFGLVTVAGSAWQIVDIGMRMLTPRELFRAQGFPDSYVIDRGHDGRRFSKAAQIRMCGNSVSPPWAAAHVLANVLELARSAPAVAAE
ncbi:DNA cytosine methyltransferase [Azospirillum sp. ST 5-10]|uniref:DNA cytosine methyltransferase n=1 Tax=unclassified Azospirillum TaxID=2630922 RepID=UPI003F4A733E